MKTITIADIRSWRPCYDPVTGMESGQIKPEKMLLPEDWRGTALDILKHEKIPAEDKLWVVCREGLVDNRTLRLFACWCARQAFALIEKPDPYSIAAVEVAERFANGQANRKELADAWNAAETAARVVWDAVRYEGGAKCATWVAVRCAWAVAIPSAWYAARQAVDSAGGDNAWGAQVQQLITLIESEIEA